MHTLGILGGMSWESTATYYGLLNQAIRDTRGGLHSAPLLIHSVDFAEVAALQRSGDWQAAGELLANAALGLQRAGATALLLATNTMHKVAAAIESAVDIPLLHIGDAVGQALQAQGVSRAALLGTRFTMQEDFYRLRLQERFGIEVITPSVAQMGEIDRVIFAELCQGQCLPASRDFYLAAVDELKAQGAQAAILGCTEIGMLLEGSHAALPLVDSTELHVGVGVEWVLRE
ncbi:aspartate/glutamate racemase family protein [Ectopseudomonas mendocina]|uniref:Aspartate/glutamate racemase family protein n=1 Tax=Ectopseudomonas mendocina TaxID=300 RepID=A0ABZ2RE21_ECTME